LLLASFGILFIILFVDDYLGVFKEKSRKSLKKVSFLFIGALFSIDCFFLLTNFIKPINPNFTISLNFCIASSILLVFVGIILNPFKQRHIIGFAYWAVFSIFLSLIVLSSLLGVDVYFIYSNIITWGVALPIFLILFPFIFMFEELIELFNHLVEVLIKKLKAINLSIKEFLKRIKALFILFYNKIVLFFKTYYKQAWLIISVLLCILIFYLLSTFLNLILTLLVSITSFVLLTYIVSPAKFSEDQGRQFKWKMIYYIAIWLTLTAVIVGFISTIPVYLAVLIKSLTLIFIALISSIIFGAIILVYIYREEKKGRISIKWRFFSTLFCILVLGAIIAIGGWLIWLLV
jgi:hypothetical protein